MNLLLNSLPTRTWNRLGMNETAIRVEGAFENHTPKADWHAAQVSWTADGNAMPGAVRPDTDLAKLTAHSAIGVVETREGAVMESPIVLSYDYSGQECAASRLVLHAEKGSTLSAIIVVASPEDGRDISALRTEVCAEDGAKVHLCVAQLLGRESVCLHEIVGICAEDAQVTLTRLELGAGKAYTDVNFDLQGRRSRFTSDVGYRARTGQLLDMNYVATHHGKNTESLMEVSGTMEEDSKKIFRGTIDFQKGCAGDKGTENENVLLLGENMKNQTIPLILCKEEDVEGNHGASIGQLDDKMLFYLGSRGISEEKAQEIISRSRIEAVCDQIPDESVRDRVHEFMNRGGSDHAEEI